MVFLEGADTVKVSQVLKSADVRAVHRANTSALYFLDFFFPLFFLTRIAFMLLLLLRTSRQMSVPCTVLKIYDAIYKIAF